MTGETDCTAFLQWALPRLRLRWAGFRRVHHQVAKCLRRRLHELRLETLEQYRHRLETHPHVWAVLDNLCHVTISCFYRDRQVFDCLRDMILPELARSAFLHSRPIRCLCAGCASGEEVFTLKILWDLDVRPKTKPVEFEVIGTDADEAVLRRALNGCFSFGSLKDALVHWIDAAFERQQQLYCIRPAYRDGVAFERQDNRSELPAGLFDLVFCRNIVFTYFEAELQRAVLERVANLLRVGGYLVIGAYEQLPDSTGLFEPRAGCRKIFRRAGSGRACAADLREAIHGAIQA